MHNLNNLSFLQKTQLDLSTSKKTIYLTISPLDHQVKNIKISLHIQNKKIKLNDYQSQQMAWSCYEQVFQISDLINKSIKASALKQQKILHIDLPFTNEKQSPNQAKKAEIILMSDQDNRNSNTKEISNKISLNNFNSKSMLWIKLYLQQYFMKTKSQIQQFFCQKFDKIQDQQQQEEENTKTQSKKSNSILYFSNELFIRKIYKTQERVTQITRTLQLKSSSKQEGSHDKGFLLIKVDPLILAYDRSIFESPFLLVLPRKTDPNQKILSQVDIQQQKQRKQSKRIEEIFFDNKMTKQFK